MPENYIEAYYTWVTGNTITADRLNGNESNIVDGLSGGVKAVNVGKILVNSVELVNSSREGTFTLVTVDNLTINGNTIASTSGAINLTPVSGSAVVIDGHWSFDANSLTSLTNANTTIAAYAGRNITIESYEIDGASITIGSNENGTITAYPGRAIVIESVFFDGGGMTGVTSLALDNLLLDGNTLSSTSGAINLTPVSGSAVVIDSHWSFDGTVLTAITDADTTITAYAGRNISIETVTFDGGLIYAPTSIGIGISNPFTLLHVRGGTTPAIDIQRSADNTAAYIETLTSLNQPSFRSGTESSVAGTTFSGSTANAAFVGSVSNVPLHLLTNNTIAATISTSGIPSWPSLPCGNIYKSADQSVNSASETAITFDTENFDVKSEHSTSVNTSRITVSVTGKYMFTARAAVDIGAANDSTYVIGRFKIDGSSSNQSKYMWNPSGETTYINNFVPCVVSDVLSLTAGQYVEFFIEHNGGSARDVIATSTSMSWYLVA